MPADSLNPEPQSFQSAYRELEQIVQEVENDRVELDDLLVKIERAQALTAWCEAKLRSTEEAVRQAISRSEGSTQ